MKRLQSRTGNICTSKREQKRGDGLAEMVRRIVALSRNLRRREYRGQKEMEQVSRDEEGVYHIKLQPEKKGISRAREKERFISDDEDDYSREEESLEQSLGQNLRSFRRVGKLGMVQCYPAMESDPSPLPHTATGEPNSQDSDMCNEVIVTSGSLPAKLIMTRSLYPQPSHAPNFETSHGKSHAF